MDNNGYLAPFVEYIDFISWKWECTPDMMAPIGSIIQASGMGKSRLMIKAAKHRFTMFICLHNTGEKGYPFRSRIIEHMPTDSRFVTHWLLQLIIARMHHLVKTLSWISMQLDPSKQLLFWDAIWYQMNSKEVHDADLCFHPESLRTSVT
ncbi:hypothetical protein BC831DRAFT_156204 [Entophlyctis helioformis]|nr:hypothetical protein BC831DRAFT_156204 [Entophlyctis helioformis]